MKKSEHTANFLLVIPHNFFYRTYWSVYFIFIKNYAILSPTPFITGKGTLLTKIGAVSVHEYKTVSCLPGLSLQTIVCSDFDIIDTLDVTFISSLQKKRKKMYPLFPKLVSWLGLFCHFCKTALG